MKKIIEFFTGFKIWDWIIFLLPFIYIAIFIKVIAPIYFIEELYFQIVTIIMLIGFPIYSFFWFKLGNKGK